MNLDEKVEPSFQSLLTKTSPNSDDDTFSLLSLMSAEIKFLLENEFDWILQNGEKDECVRDNTLISIFSQDIQRLTTDEINVSDEEAYMNDTIIECYLEDAINKWTHQRQKFLFLPTVFCTKLYENAHNVEDQTPVNKTLRSFRKPLSKIKIGQTILLPAECNKHWILIVVDTQENHITCFNSYWHCWVNPSIKTLVSRVADAFTQAGKCNKDVSDYFDIIMKRDIPRQFDARNCGVFVMAYARCIIENLEMNFTEQHCKVEFRKSIACTLLKGKKKPNLSNEIQNLEEDMDAEELEEGMEVDSVDENVLEDEPRDETSVDDCVEQLASQFREVTLLDLDDVETLTADEDKIIITALTHYTPSLKLINNLRKEGKTPFYDVLESGLCISNNHHGDWRKFRTLREVLIKLGGWEVLFDLLKNDPSTAMDWARDNSAPGQGISPTSFQFGSAQNFKRIAKFMREEHMVSIINSHSSYKRRGKKKVT